MANEKFKVGDTIKLRSGGPLMTITDIGTNDDGSQKIWTAWFDKNDKEATGFYPAAAVEAADGSEPDMLTG